jgi:hypothetical protein
MSTTTVAPSSERIVIARLLQAPAIAEGRVYPWLPDGATFPAVVVQLVGGEEIGRTWQPAGASLPPVADRVQIDVYAEDKAQGGDLAAVTLQRLLATSGIVQWADGTKLGAVSGIETSLRPRWNPETVSARPRYTFEVRVYARAVTPSGT